MYILIAAVTTALDTRIFSERHSLSSMTQGNPRTRIAAIS